MLRYQTPGARWFLLVALAICIHTDLAAQTPDERCANAIADLPQQIAKAKEILKVKQPETPQFVDFPDECYGVDAVKDAQRKLIIDAFRARAGKPEEPVIYALMNDAHVLDTFKRWPPGQSLGQCVELADDLVSRLLTKAQNFVSENSRKNSNRKAALLAINLVPLVREAAVMINKSSELGIKDYLKSLEDMFYKYGEDLASRLKKTHDFSLIPAMNLIPREVAILGGSTDPADYDNTFARATRCQLRVEYLLRFQNSDGNKYSYRLVGEMPVAYHFAVGGWLDGKYVFPSTMTKLDNGTVEGAPTLPILQLDYKQAIVEGKQGTSHIKSMTHVVNNSETSQTTSQVDPTFDTTFILRVMPCDPRDSAFVFKIPELGKIEEQWISEGNNGKSHDFTMKGAATARGYANLFLSEWADVKANSFVFTSSDLHNGQAVLFDKTFTSSVIPSNKGIGQVHITLTHIAK